MDEAGIELTVSDPAELRSLGDWLRSVPGLRVARESGSPAAGEQGALDYLELLAGSSVLVAAVRMIPDFLRARRAGLTVTVTRRGEKLTIRADDAEDVLPVLERMIER